MQNIQRIPRVNFMSLTKSFLFLFLSLTFFLHGAAYAREGADTTPKQVTSVSQANTTPTPFNSRLKSIADSLQERTKASRSFQRQALKSAPLLPQEEDEIAGILKELGPAVQTKFHPIAGTPRQIKGAVLDKAVIKEGSEIDQAEKTARKFLRQKRALLRVDDPDHELSFYRYHKDHLNRRHLRFSQVYRDLSIWPSELNVHLDPDGNVDMLDGAFVPTPKKILLEPLVDFVPAIEKARLEVPDGGIATVSDYMLIIYAPADKASRLGWKVELFISAKSHWVVVIDAVTGISLTAFNKITDTNVLGTGIDLSGTPRQLNVWEEGSVYYMVDTSKPIYDASSDPPNPKTTRGAIIVRDARNEPEDSFHLYDVSSSTATSGWLRDAVSAYYNLSETYNYYVERHNRNSIDGQGGSILAAVRLGQNFARTFWNSELNMIAFGDAQPYADSLDIVAHEITHGVTSHTSNLIYRDQSGALNEAFSDILGEMVEARTRGDNDWLIGSALNEPLRSLSNPSSMVIGGSFGPYPSKMSEYYHTAEDNGGVHINSLIVGHAFYLLTAGLPGAIGRQDAEKIFYRALAVHLVANSQFIDARLAAIASAEELFGQGSTQALKTAEAFDAVEIPEDAATPEPASFPSVNAPDSFLFVYLYYDEGLGWDYYLGRREAALGDGAEGVPLTWRGVSLARPSVSGDGSFAVFVDANQDICSIYTDGETEEECLGYPGLVSSVAMSPDGNLFGFVFLDENGYPTNSISVIDLRPDGQIRTFQLVAPTIDGTVMNTILFAGDMDFSADGHYIYYDALNLIQLADGSEYDAWSIYAIDLLTEQTLAIVPPVPGVHIGFPALSQTSDNFITFDASEVGMAQSTIYALNMTTGNFPAIATVATDYGVPSYTGDDSGIIYSQPDVFSNTGFSLWLQPVEQDHITPKGLPTPLLNDGGYGVVYRRGSFASPEPNISVSPESLLFGEGQVGNILSASLIIANIGTANLKIDELSVAGANASEFSLVGGCLGQTLAPTGVCTASLLFAPVSEGAKSAILSIKSNDPDTPVVDVRMSGLGFMPQHTIVATAGVHGSITPAGNVLVNHGESQRFDITTDEGYHIVDVLVNGQSVGAVASYTFSSVTSDQTISASFELNPVTIIPGDVDNNKKIELLDAILALQVVAGKNPVSPVFKGSDVNKDGKIGLTEALYVLRVIGYPQLNRHTITASAEANGSISPSGTVRVYYNADQQFTITPDQGYHIANVLVNGQSVGTSGTYIFRSVVSDQTIQVTFEAAP